MAALRCPLRSRAIPACLGIHSLAQSSLPLSNWRAPSSPCLSATRSLRGACGAIFHSPRTPRVPQFPAPASGGSRISRASPVSGASPVSRRSPPSAAAGGSIRRGSGSAPATPPASLLNLAEVSEQLPADLSGYLARVRECNAGLERRWEFIPLVVNGEVVGYIHHSFWQHLEPFGDVFSLHHHAPSSTTATTTNSSGTNAAAAAAAAGRVLSFSGRLEAAGAAERTEAVGGVLQRLREQGVVTGWRNELYPVGASFYAPPAFLIERAAVPLFGTKAYGVHMNGYTHLPSSSSSLHLWVARRSPLKPTFPNQLDHLVAGGQPHGISCRDNMIKECEEEADIPRHLAERAVPVGVVSYEIVTAANTLKRDVLFCYDLLLPPDFTPRNTDGEVAEFSLLPIEAVANIVANTKEYKANCNLVIIDFLIRHGMISPDSQGYLELLTGLRQGSCA